MKMEGLGKDEGASPGLARSAFHARDLNSVLSRVESVDQLRDELVPFSLQSALDDSFRTRMITRQIFETSHERGWELSIYRSQSGTWCIVADDRRSIERNIRKIDLIDGFAADLNPRHVGGCCMYVHHYAEKMGLADGRAGSNEGGHVVGFIHSPETGDTVYFDLEKTLIVDGKSLSNGMIFIDSLDSREKIDAVYGFCFDEISSPGEREKGPTLEQHLRWFHSASVHPAQEGLHGLSLVSEANPAQIRALVSQMKISMFPGMPVEAFAALLEKTMGK